MRLRDFIRTEKGGVSIITGLSGLVVMGFAGLAIDTGAVYLQSRRLQGAVDLAALTAVQNINSAEAVAAETIRRNRFPIDTRVDVVRGAYAADRSIDPDDRFQRNAAEVNAVRVEAHSSARLYFGSLFMPRGRMDITRRATATQSRLASFQIGSRLMSLHGGVANQILSGLAGGSVDLSVMDYNALLRADVDLLSYVNALRTRLDMEAATYDETLSQDVALPIALGALSDVLNDVNARAAVMDLVDGAQSANRRIGLDELIDLGPYTAQDHATQSESTAIQVNAFDLASAMLQIAGRDRQVRLSLGAQVPGVASTNVWLAIGERPNQSPWLAVTDDEEVVIRTAQARLYVESEVRATSAIAVRAPILLELASAQARLERIDCSVDGRRREVTLEVAPSVGALTLGEIDVNQLDNFRRDLRPTAAQIVRIPLARVEGQARVDAGGEQWTSVRFTKNEIDQGTVKTVATRNIAQASISTLLGNTSLTVRALGLGLNTSALTATVRPALTSMGAPLDGLVNGLSDLLGIHLGEADVRVNGVRCGGAVLVG